MLLLQISVHLVFTVPFGVVYSMNALSPSTKTPNILAVRYIFAVWQQCDYFLSFFLYIFSGSTYRLELARILQLSRRQNLFIRRLKTQRIGPIRQLPIADHTL